MIVPCLRRFSRMCSPLVRVIVRLTAILLLILVVFLAAWWAYLFGKARELIARSDRFPHEYYVGDSAAPPATYVVLGDSTAYGTGAGTLAETYPHQCAEELASQGFHLHVVNISRVGACVADVVRDQVPRLETLKPTFITLTIGANDATHFTALDGYARSVAEIVAALARWQVGGAWMASAPDMALVPALPPGIARAVGARALVQNAILGKALEESPVVLVDIYTRGKLDPHQNPAYYASDRFHPAAAGYAVWARLFREAIWRGE